MMSLQERIVDEFLKVAGEKTMTEYGALLGLERTRFFRLFHGAEMRLSEFEKFQIYLNKARSESLNWEEEVRRSQENLAFGKAEGAGTYLALQWRRNIRLKELLRLATQSKLKESPLTA